MPIACLTLPSVLALPRILGSLWRGVGANYKRRGCYSSLPSSKPAQFSERKAWTSCLSQQVSLPDVYLCASLHP